MDNGQDHQILKAIRQQQLALLQNTFLSLLSAIQDTSKIYQQDTETDYRRFFSKLIDGFAALDAEKPIIAEQFEELQETPEQRKAMLELYAEVVGYLCRIDYIPPCDPWDILLHLHILNRLLTDGKPDLSITDYALCMNFGKLLSAGSEAKAHQLTKDSRELPRSVKSSRARKAKAQGKQETVLRIYRLLKKTDSFRKMTLNAVANAIKNNWDKFPPPSSEKSPGLTTIKDYLKQDPQIMGELKD